MLYMIRLTNITKDYQVGDEVAHVLRGISLAIKEKEYISILGASGSGKSTLMYIVGLLDTPTSGRVEINGRDVSKFPDTELSKLRNHYVGFVFQQFNLINKLSVFENVLLPTRYASERLGFDPNTRALELLRQFGLYERRDYYPNRISGGQQQKTAIVRALIMNPKLIIADEPTGNLDTKTGKEILDLLGTLNKKLGVTILMVTHEKHVARQTKRQIFIRDGRIVRKYL